MKSVRNDRGVNKAEKGNGPTAAADGGVTGVPPVETAKPESKDAGDDFEFTPEMARADAEDMARKLVGNPFTTFGDCEHWAEDVSPTTAKGKEIVYADYNGATWTETKDERRTHLEMAAIVFSGCYERIINMGPDKGGLESILGDLAGLYQLVKHNPHFKAEKAALRAILEGYEVMDQFREKVENL